MKKNNKGFFLAETIVMIALVTSIMAFVYPNVSKLYENYKDRVVYYDQTEDIYKLKYVYDYIQNNKNIKEYIVSKEQLNEIGDIDNELKKLKISKLYITGYMTSQDVVPDEEYDFKRYISRLKKTTYDTSSYRLIGIFEYEEDENKITKYASIKIDNPNSVSIVGDDNE